MDKLTVMHGFCRIVERGSFARAAEDLDAQVKRSTDVVDGHLRVNAPGSFGQVVIVPMLPALLARYPALTLSLSLDDRVVDMVEGGFDLTIRIRTALPDSGLVARRLADIRQQLYASPAYLAAHGRPQCADDLAAHRCVAYLLADHSAQWELDGLGGPQLLRFDPQLRVGSSLVLRDMLVAGQGIGALPDFIADAAVRGGLLVRVLPDHALPARHVYAVTAARHGLDARVSAFLAHLQAALQPG